MAGIFCSINMALEMGRGGMCFVCSQSLLLFKLKDAEILQTDPTQFLPFLWIVGNLILQTQGWFKSEFLKFRVKSEFCERSLGSGGLTILLLFLVAVSSMAIPIAASTSTLGDAHASIANLLPSPGDSWAFGILLPFHMVTFWLWNPGLV